jgi:pyridoxine 4-dehydrogenase
VQLLVHDGVAYVPYFPLGGMVPLQSSAPFRVARQLDATPMQVALAWLPQHAPNILPIPGTSSLTHLRENMAAASLTLPADAIKQLDAVGQIHAPLHPSIQPI